MLAPGPYEVLDPIPASIEMSVHNPSPATGGLEAETIDAAWRRAPFFIRANDRAVTAEDYEYLSREAAPDLARVHCSIRPDGAVQVLLVPFASINAQGELNLDDLIPDASLFNRVTSYLEDRRVIGTRLVVAPARYRGLTVVAQVIRKPSVAAQDVHFQTLQVLNGYFNPITGGPQGTGWPFGRPVHIGDVFGVLQQVGGIDRVDKALMFPGDARTGQRESAAQHLQLDSDELIYSRGHMVRVQP
jgi:predicted phage baseplate assembly protein